MRSRQQGETLVVFVERIVEIEGIESIGVDDLDRATREGRGRFV